MKSFTLDMNCLIAIENDEPAKVNVLALIEAADAKKISLSMVASGASERQPGGVYLNNIADFKERMRSLWFASVDLLKPIGRQDISFWDHAIYGSEEAVAREKQIFEALFPQHSASWAEYSQLMEQTWTIYHLRMAGNGRTCFAMPRPFGGTSITGPIISSPAMTTFAGNSS